MILNSGLDAACTNSAGSITNVVPSFGRFIRYAAYGTGSAAPDASQTTLGAQVGARGDNNGGFALSEDGGLDSTGNVIWYEGTITRVFSVPSNLVATEWGLAAGATGNLSVRELFRTDPSDNGSAPIALSLEAGDELQLVITYRIEATWEYESKTFVITGTAGNDANGAHTGKATISSGSQSAYSSVAVALSHCWPGGAIGTHTLGACLTDQSAVPKNGNLSGTAVEATPTEAAYTAGTYYRDVTATFSTSQANGDHFAWRLGSGSIGFRFLLTNPVKLTKLSTHKLTLTVRKSIARL